MIVFLLHKYKGFILYQFDGVLHTTVSWRIYNYIITGRREINMRHRVHTFTITNVTMKSDIYMCI